MKKEKLDHTEFNEVIQEIRQRSSKSRDEIARDGVPRAFYALKKAGHDDWLAKTITVHELRKDPGWAEDTIMHWMPDEGKDAQAQKNGAKGAEEQAIRREKRRKGNVYHTELVTPEHLVEMNNQALLSEDRHIWIERNYYYEYLEAKPRKKIPEPKRKVSVKEQEQEQEQEKEITAE